MTPLDQLCTTTQRIRDRADERDMAWRELKGAAEAIERMEQDVEVEGGGTSDAPFQCQHGPAPEGKSPPGSYGLHTGAAFLLSALAVFLATWGLAVLLEEPAEKPTPPFYKHFQEGLGSR